MAGQELGHKGEYSLKLFFEHVMTCMRERVNFGGGQAPSPFLQEIPIKNEVAFSPEDGGRGVAKAREASVGFTRNGVSGVFVGEGNILHEPEGDQSARWVTAGLGVRTPDVARHGAGMAPEAHRNASECVEPTNQEARNPGVPAKPYAPVHALGRGQQEGRGVEDDEPPDPLGMPGGKRHPNQAAPVVQEQGQVTLEFEVIQEGLEVGNSVG